MELTARNATLQDLAGLLEEQHTRKLDVVVPSSKLRSVGGLLHVEGVEAQVDEDGVTALDGVYRPTGVCDEGLADKLGIPLVYLRKLREQRPDLLDANVNGWLRGGSWLNDDVTAGEAMTDPRSFLLRCFRGDGGGTGIARAMLSDRFGIIDHLDVLTAALVGVRDCGTPVEVTKCDLTDRRMYVKVVAPEITALAPALVRGYRSPYSGKSGDELPVVFAGLVISNSETGGGAFTVTPRFEFQVCTNGMTITRDALRAVHLGSKLDEGAIRWSAETMQKQLELVTSKARDAVSTFLDVGYMTKILDRMEQHGDTPLPKPAENVETVCQRLKFSDERRQQVLDLFIRGGAPTVGGVMQAVTALAQTVDDADLSAELEGLGVKAFDEALAVTA